MIRVPIDEAECRLTEIIEASLRGEAVFVILRGDQGERVVRLEAAELPERRPRFGSAKGLITMSDDFDAPLEDFADYQ